MTGITEQDRAWADAIAAHVAAAVLDALGTGAGQAAVDALADLSATATPGLWRQEFYRDGELLPDGMGGMDDYVTPGSGVYVIDETSDEGYCLTEFSAGSSADAAFIVAAVNYVRAAVTTADDAGRHE